jgi:hypothetical protein
MPSWHARQRTRVLRRRAAIRLAHSGGLPFPLRLRSLSARMWCTSTWFRDPHSSHSSAMSRWTISERALQMRAGSSLRGRGAVSRAKEMPPLRDQRRFPVPVHRDLKAPAGSVPGVEDGTVAAVDRRDADPVLAGQRLGQRPFHDVLQPSEPVAVERQPVYSATPRNSDWNWATILKSVSTVRSVRRTGLPRCR